MPTRLILNADDFGLTQGINRAIAELHRAGALTSATLMATGPAFDDAVALAVSRPALGVGCHVVLVDGTPASLPHEIPSLLGRDRKTFRPTLSALVRDLLLGRIREAEITHEAEAQIRKLQRAGIRVTHVDTHKHTHIFTPVARALLLAAKRCGVTSIRNPFEPRWSAGLSNASPLRLLQLSALRHFEPAFRKLLLLNPDARTTDGTLGIAATGSLDTLSLHKILVAMKPHDDHIYELLCHPGYSDTDLDRLTTRLRSHRDLERLTLLEEIPTLRTSPNPTQLLHYGNLQDESIAHIGDLS